MIQPKISSPLNESNNSRFVERKWNIVNYQSNWNYSVGNKIIQSMKALKSNLWDLNHAYVPVRANITVVSAPVDLNLAMLM